MRLLYFFHFHSRFEFEFQFEFQFQFELRFAFRTSLVASRYLKPASSERNRSDPLTAN